MLRTALALSLIVSVQPESKGSDEASIRKVFAEYRQALLAKDGAAALAALDGDTVVYYANLREMALTADASTVKKQPLVDRMMILRLRHEIGLESLKRMDGGALFVFAVKNGWVSMNSAENVRLGKLRIAGDEAAGEFVLGEQVAPFNFTFKRNQGKWRLSLLPMLAIAEPAMKQMAQQTGREENDFILALVEQVSGKAVSENIWEPLQTPSGSTKPTR